MSSILAFILRMLRAGFPPDASTMAIRSASPFRYMSDRSRPEFSTALVSILWAMRTVSWKYTVVYIRERETIRPSAAVMPPLRRTMRSFWTIIVLISLSESMLPWETPV